MKSKPGNRNGVVILLFYIGAKCQVVMQNFQVSSTLHCDE